MTKPSPTWIELNVDRATNDIRISARGSRGEQTQARTLGVDRKTLLDFASAIQRSANHGRSLAPDVLTEAQSIQHAVLDGEVGVVFTKLRQAANGPLLVRLLVHDADLQAVPWEALCNPGEALGFWGSSPNVLPVRGVSSTEPWIPREVRGAVRVLAIAPTGTPGLANLKRALEERIATGEVEWLEPIEGRAAKASGIFDRLRREPVPHVIHFLGHGGIDKGLPALRLTNTDDDEETWLPVELLAQSLVGSFRGLLRLIVLEACEGAKPSAFASAAEILARAGADAVVAHLWPVRADVARTCSTQFYRALVGADRGAGDVALALNEARRAILGTHESSAEAMSPVVYLRGHESNVFDFQGRKVAPPREVVGSSAGIVDPALARIVGARFSLVLGDRWKNDQATLDTFRDKLRNDLPLVPHPPPTGLPMGTLTQWFALHRGRDVLEQEFQDTFGAHLDEPPIVETIARLLGPGVHTTLLRNPWLELSLAKQQPRRTIYVVQPSDSGTFVVKREAGAINWVRVKDPARDRPNVEQDILILRAYRGYTSNKNFARPLLTEDDYSLGLLQMPRLNVRPEELADTLWSALGARPVLILGLSMLTSNHRMLLHALYGDRGVPPESLAVIERDDHEREIWTSGTGLRGQNPGIKVIETISGELNAALAAIGREAGQ